MARRLGIPVRTWYNYEAGVTVPAEVILKIIELTSVEPIWLLHGKGPKFRQGVPERRESGIAAGDDGRRPAADGAAAPGGPGLGRVTGVGLGRRGDHAAAGLDRWEPRRRPRPGRPARISIRRTASIRMRARGPDVDLAARSEWLAAQREGRCIDVVGDAMAPIVADGASVAYSHAGGRPRPAPRQAGRRLDRGPADGPLVPALRPLRPAPRREPRHRSPSSASSTSRTHDASAPVPPRPLDQHAALTGACRSAVDRPARVSDPSGDATSSGTRPRRAARGSCRRRSGRSAPGRRSP